jgi:hypothetical protein
MEASIILRRKDRGARTVDDGIGFCFFLIFALRFLFFFCERFFLGLLNSVNLNVIFSFCREINGEKKNFCLVTNPRKKLKYRMFTEAES